MGSGWVTNFSPSNVAQWPRVFLLARMWRSLFWSSSGIPRWSRSTRPPSTFTARTERRWPSPRHHPSYGPSGSTPSRPPSPTRPRPRSAASSSWTRTARPCPTPTSAKTSNSKWTWLPMESTGDSPVVVWPSRWTTPGSSKWPMSTGNLQHDNCSFLQSNSTLEKFFIFFLQLCIFHCESKGFFFVFFDKLDVENEKKFRFFSENFFVFFSKIFRFFKKILINFRF